MDFHAQVQLRWLFGTVQGSLGPSRGFTQRPGVDYDETFSPVVKPATVRTMLSLVVSRSWPVHQLNVKNVFLHGTLSETIYCSQPTGFVDPAQPDRVCLLNKSLYGLKQTLRTWYSRFITYITSLGFVEAKFDTSLQRSVAPTAGTP
jgi:hypothetical protein